MVLEELFWVDLLNKSLEKTKGNVAESCEILGISSTTFRLRCKRHGVDASSYRDKKVKERKDRIETRKYWKYLITRAMEENQGNKVEAAKSLGWTRSTFYRRMQIIGATQKPYKKWHLNIEGIKS